jgi:hypothetical protein
MVGKENLENLLHNFPLLHFMQRFIELRRKNAEDDSRWHIKNGKSLLPKQKGFVEF